MPLYLQKNIAPDVILAVWQITESIADLKQLLGNGFFEHEMQQKMERGTALHYLASRVLLICQFPNARVNLHKNKFNKPMLEIDGMPHFVSITHSHNYAGIIFSKTMETGIDLELIDKRINRVAHKFMNAHELSYAGDEHQILAKTLIWSAKEALYKIYGEKEVDFRQHLSIYAFVPAREGTLQTRIKKNDYENQVEIKYACFDNYVLTYGITGHV